MTRFHCTSCGAPYPDKFAYRCPECDGVFGVAGQITYFQRQVAPNLPGIWRYQHTFGLPLNAPIISLGEGNTPLVNSRAFGREIYFKLEYMNPTGSFKDRLTAPEISYLIALRVEEAVEDSSGNAGASFAAYAARAGIKGRVFVPSYASGPKREQISAYGVELVSVPGPRSAAAEAVMAAVEEGAAYASHAYLPFGAPGLATLAYEIFEQLGQIPGAVIAPVGHGSLLLGIAQGFIALQKAGLIEDIPVLVGVQAMACAPVWALATMGPSGSKMVAEGETVAEGVRVRNPVRGEALAELAVHYPIKFVAVDEESILPGRDLLARLGFYVEATSAVVWNGSEQVVADLPDPIAVILTGSGLKSYHP
jgi:threonine synthase